MLRMWCTHQAGLRDPATAPGCKGQDEDVSIYPQNRDAGGNEEKDPGKAGPAQAKQAKIPLKKRTW